MNCIYCDSPLNKGNRSQEHVIPQWIIRKLKAVKNKHEFVPITKNLEALNARKPVTNTLTHSICVNCNNGWLSLIDESGKKLLSNLISENNINYLDIKRDLNPLFTLIYKIFLNFIATSPFSFNDLKKYIFLDFFTNKKPPSNVSLFFCNIRGNSPIFVNHADIWLIENDKLLYYKEPLGLKFKFYLQLGNFTFVLCSTGDLKKSIIFDPRYLFPISIPQTSISLNLGLKHRPPEPFEDNIVNRVLYNSIQMIELFDE